MTQSLNFIHLDFVTISNFMVKERDIPDITNLRHISNRYFPETQYFQT